MKYILFDLDGTLLPMDQEEFTQNYFKYLDLVQKTMNEVGIGHIATISGRYWAMDRDKNLDRIDVSYRVLVDHDGNSYEEFAQDYNDMCEEEEMYEL